MDCLLAQERAEGVVQGLELAQVQPISTTERLYLIDDAAKLPTGRLGVITLAKSVTLFCSAKKDRRVYRRSSITSYVLA